MRIIAVIFLLSLFVAGCSGARTTGSNLSPDQTVVTTSQYPQAVDPKLVGSYPAMAKSGAGYFYDDVLEYRVWINPEGGDDYYRAFACFEPALEFSKSTPGADEPLVLIRQLEWIDEPQPGEFEARSGERITEWQTAWLSGSRRTEHSITGFLSEKRGKQ